MSASNGHARRPRVLFVGNTPYDLPLDAGLARKWDGLSERMEPRVVARAGDVREPDPRFRLLRLPARAPHGSFQALLPPLVAAEIRSFEPDVVIVQSPYEAVPVVPLLRLGRTRPALIVEVHGDWRAATRLYGSRVRQTYATLADRAAEHALARADGVRSLSPFTASLAQEVTGREPLAVFPTYWDDASFAARPVQPLPVTPAIAWVGALQRYKNVHGFARAWRLVAERVPEARLTMVGDGPMREVADGLGAEFGERVRVEPRLPPEDVARVLDDSTLLALPSWVEGMGRVVIEAFTRGRPVVGGDAGGIPDLVVPGRNGLLVEPGDAEALAGALERVLTDRDLAERLSRGALEDAPNLQLDADSYADAVRDMVDRVMAGRAVAVAA